MQNPDVIVIGASTGGVEALSGLVKALPPAFPAAIFVVTHTAPHGPGLLAEILSHAGALPATHARDGEIFQTGKIYVAPPDQHMLLGAGGVLRLSRGPKENRSRPAIDPLFRSAALAFGSRVIGVILTGALDDGAAGLAAVKACGGLAVVQSPRDARAPSMPLSALRAVTADHCVPLSEMGPLLTRLASEPIARKDIETEVAMPAHIETEVAIASGEHVDIDSAKALGAPTLFTCPECHGTLMQLPEPKLLRFRCHAGHAYTANSFVAALAESTEDVLWNAVRTLEENVLILRHMAAHESEDQETANQLLRQSESAEKRVVIVRRALDGESADGGREDSRLDISP